MSILSRCANRLLWFCQIQRGVLCLSNDAAKPQEKKKKTPEVRINVIEKMSLTVMSMESAVKLANRRGLLLSSVEKPAGWMLAGNRTPYLLQPPSVKVATPKEDNMKNIGFKGLKHAVIGIKIQEHDLATKIKQITKWISSGYVVDVAVDQSEKTEGIVKRIEEEVKETAKLPGDVKRNNKNLVRMRYEPINKIACKDQKS